MKSRLVLLIGLSLLSAASAKAQDGEAHLSAFARGAGGTYSTTSRGLDAIGLNPALLGLPSARPFAISIFPISSFGLDAGPSFSQLNTVSGAFNGKTVNDSALNTIVDLLYDNKLSGRADARIFAASYDIPNNGTIAIAWTMHAAIRTFIPDTILSFLRGDEVTNLTQHVLPKTSGLDLQGLWYAKYGVTYARPLMGNDAEDGDFQIIGGLGLNYVSGIAYSRLDPDSYISINKPHDGGTSAIVLSYKIQFAYPDQFDPNNLPSGFSFNLLTSASAGSGYGVDAGIVMGPKGDHPAWRLAASLADLGQITWNNNTDSRSTNQRVVINYQQQTGESITDSLQSLAGKLDTTDASFTTKLPTTLHVGASFDLAGLGLMPAGIQTSFAAEYIQGLTDVVGTSKSARYGFGVILERPSSTLSVHGAVGLARQDFGTDVTLGLGFGIANTFLLDFGTGGITSLLKNDGHSDAAFSLKVLL